MHRASKSSHVTVADEEQEKHARDCHCTHDEMVVAHFHVVRLSSLEAVDGRGLVGQLSCCRCRSEQPLDSLADLIDGHVAQDESPQLDRERDFGKLERWNEQADSQSDGHGCL